MDTIIPGPTSEEWSEATTLPEAIKLVRSFVRHERQWSRARLAPIEPEQHREYMRDLDNTEATLDRAMKLWREEHDIMRTRLAARLRAELPQAIGHGIVDAVEQDDYTKMAC